MTTMPSQITSLTIVYSIDYSDADQRKHQSSASLVFVCGIHRDRTKGQLRGKWFRLMTSSWITDEPTETSAGNAIKSQIDIPDINLRLQQYPPGLNELMDLYVVYAMCSLCYSYDAERKASQVSFGLVLSWPFSHHSLLWASFMIKSDKRTDVLKIPLIFFGCTCSLAAKYICGSM